MKMMVPLISLGILAACAEESNSNKGESGAAEIAVEDADALRVEQKSIEEAADAAAKLVEEESRTTIDQTDEENARQP